MKKSICWIAVCLAAIWLGAGCEDHTIGGELVDAVKEDKSDKGNGDLTGTWKGISGTEQGETTVTVREVDGALSGSLRWWWGGTRNFTGTREGNSVRWVLDCEERDDWRLTLSSDRKRLTGHASKNDGGGYAVSLSR